MRASPLEAWADESEHKVASPGVMSMAQPCRTWGEVHRGIATSSTAVLSVS